MEVFKSYASGTKSKALVMSSNEFSRVVMDSKCLPPEKIWKILDLYHNSMVKEAGIRNRSGKLQNATEKLMVRPDRPVVTTALDMAGFLVAMRNIAFARFLEQTDGKLSPEQIKELGRNKIKSITDAVQVPKRQCPRHS
jgi:hypothetical protein